MSRVHELDSQSTSVPMGGHAIKKDRRRRGRDQSPQDGHRPHPLSARSKETTKNKEICASPRSSIDKCPVCKGVHTYTRVDDEVVTIILMSSCAVLNGKEEIAKGRLVRESGG